MIDDPSYISEPADIPEWIATCANLGIVNVNCVCSNDLGKDIVCYVATDEQSARRLATAISGEVLNRSTVVRSLKIPPEFYCKGRTEDLQVRKEECSCGLSYP